MVARWPRVGRYLVVIPISWLQRRIIGSVNVPTHGETWVGLTSDVLPVAAAYEWAVRPDCGAVVLFSGTARDYAAGRPGVSLLEYEAYEEHIEPRLQAIADVARDQWPGVGRMVLLHRIGPVPIGESSVIVVASSGHRPDAFEAARFGIDTLKATVPIWKREQWDGGEDFALGSQPIAEVAEIGGTP